MSVGNRGRGMGTRQVLLTLTVTVLAVSASIVAVRIAPDHKAEPEHAALAGRSPVTSAAPSSHPSSKPLKPSSDPPAANESAPRFAGWVYEVANWLDIPRRAMRAYASATVTLQQQQPGCNLSWVTLAGIGKIASDHGRVGERELDEQGVPDEEIGTIDVRDFSGELISIQGAAGPLQLGPRVWRSFAASASGDAPNVQDIDDAALTAGNALCAGERDLATGDDWVAAVSALQDAPLYVHRVLATATVYGTVGQHPSPPDPKALRAVDFAIDKIGLPYVWGGDGKRSGDVGFDCSGLTKTAYSVSEVPIPRTAHAQFEAVPRIPSGTDPKLGDLIFFGTPAHIHHVGIYIGNNQMIDAPTFGQAVQVHPYRTPGDDFVSAGRPTS